MARAGLALLIALLLISCAPTRGVISFHMPQKVDGFAEIVLDGVQIWAIQPLPQRGYGRRELAGYEVTDYVSFSSPIWVGPGAYRVSFGCPGKVHSYSNKSNFEVSTIARYSLRCSQDGKLTISR
jgi:hypothetical protein